LGTTGCVSYMFEQKGVIVIEKEGCPLSEDDLIMEALYAGAEDFSSEDEVYEIKTDPQNFTAVTESLTSTGITFLEAGVQMIPSNYIQLDEQAAEKMQRLIDNLEDLDDVLEVYHNWEE
ncbi:MAG: YebC/PmpR family DNA-binding transcriptional regulator, partial [Clostridia bacterium]|nr:YebC/PmpR family DNA-binding transcriptional regulator [Clostridia bacterium]